MRMKKLFAACFLVLNSVAWAEAPSQPAALRVEIYSDTAAELFWTRSTDDSLLLEYEITINGVFETVLDGSSYFTDSLIKGVSYELMVTAIDNARNRSTPATVSFIGGDRDQTGTNTPQRPTNVSLSVYSQTAAELFWDRVPGVALNYEISINDETVTTSQASSFFTDDLDADQNYTFSIMAIDAHGNRSKAVSVQANTAGGPVSFPPSGPAAPTNPSFNQYSQTAGELFWDRAPSDNQVVSTEVNRDGFVIGMAEGNSFFDDTREPDIHYQYLLVAIDSRGRRSTATEVIEMPELPIINRDNHIDIVADALTVYFGDTYHALLFESLDILLSRFLNEALSELTFPVTHVCANGGTAFFESSPFDIQFTNCFFGDALHDGHLGILSNTAGVYSDDGLSIVSTSGTTLLFDGAIRLAGQDFYSTMEVNALLTDPTRTLSLAAANTSFSFTHRLRCCSGSPNFLAQFNGSYDFFSSTTDDRIISVATIKDFDYAEPFETHSTNWNYRTGLLKLVAMDDNSELVLDANTGDDNTVLIRLTNRTGMEEFLQPWSLWHGVLRRNP